MSDEVLDLATIAKTFHIDYSLKLMGTVLMVHDYLITFPSEVRHIWRRPKSFSSISFLLYRYISLVTRIACAILPLMPLGNLGCQRLLSFEEYTLLTIQIAVCCLLTLRTYALYDRSKRLLAFLILIALLCLVVEVWSLTGRRGFAVSTNFGCSVGLPKDSALYSALSWELLVAFDVLILGLTISKTYKAARFLRRLTIMSGRTSLTVLMLRDGAIFFATMALANGANILTFYLLMPTLKGSLSTFSSSIAVIMVSRLMLGLHEGASSGILSSDTAVREFVDNMNLDDV